MQYTIMDNDFYFNMDKLMMAGDVCLCCLAKNVKFVSLAKCKHTSFLEFFFNLKFQDKNAVVCYICHNLLNKIELFKVQVEGCLGTFLRDQISPALQTGKCLVWSTAERTTDLVENDVKPVTEINHLKQEANSDTTQYELTMEVKIENEVSDLETDMPLSEIRKEIKKVKKKKSRKCEGVSERKSSSLDRRGKFQEKYEGKIRIIMLDREEIMLERERDALKESYLKLPYKCTDCIVGFDHELTLKDHMANRHGKDKNGYMCEICKSVLGSIASYRLHVQRHAKRYECVECGKRNNDVYSVASHYNMQHGTLESQYTCKDCGFTTTSHRGYRYHRDKHKQKVACEECGVTFVSRSGLKVHMYTVHKHSDRVYSCADCNKVYNARSGLLAHLAATHSNAGAYCAPCGTHFRTEQGLALHVKKHSKHITEEDRRFKCNECSSRYLTKAALQEHINFVHLKITTHQCAKCDKVFKNRYALKRHENYVHKKIRPPRNKICDHCGRGFTSMAILRSHIRTHTGERPLQCAHCPASFAHSAALYTHNKLLHNSARAGH